MIGSDAGGSSDVAPSETGAPGAGGGVVTTGAGVLAPATGEMAKSADSTGVTGGSVGVPAAIDNSPVSLDAKIAHTAAMELQVKRGDFSAAWQRATRVATAAGGSVTSSSTSDTGNAPRTGTMTLRVPSDHFQGTLDGLSGVGSVRSLATGSQDETQTYVDTSSRLRHDRAVESRLLTLLARTNTVSEALAVQNRLDAIQSQIEVETGRIQYLASITSFSTIDLTITESGHRAVKQPLRAHTSSLGHALNVASARFTANVGRGIVWLGGALPLLLLAAALALAACVLIGRRNRAAG